MKTKENELIFTLDKAAKKAGGDKYICQRPGKQEITIYLPQDISRPDFLGGTEKITKTFRVTLETFIKGGEDNA